MTDKELAKHWGVSLKEVQRIRNYMNEHFRLEVVWYVDGFFRGLIYHDPEQPKGNLYPFPVAIVPKTFKTKREAIPALNQFADTWKMPQERAKELGVPQDACRVLTKFPQPVRRYHVLSIQRDREIG